MEETNFENSVAKALDRNKLLRRSEVKALTKLGDTKRQELINAGLFPKPIKQMGASKMPGRTNYWTQGDIHDYLEACVAERDKRIAEIASEGLNGWLSQAVQKAAGSMGKAGMPKSRVTGTQGAKP